VIMAFNAIKPTFRYWKVGFLLDITLLKHRVKLPFCHHGLTICCNLGWVFSSIFSL
jgi:hypothetical protein